jgi:hypothetical protein
LIRLDSSLTVGLNQRASSLPATTRRRRGLVDLLVAVGRVLWAHLDAGTGLVELEVVGRRTVLENGDLILGVAGVRYPLDARALVRVVPGVRDVERLVQDRGESGSKRHIVVDRNGVSLAVMHSAANVHDSKMLEEAVEYAVAPRYADYGVAPGGLASVL